MNLKPAMLASADVPGALGGGAKPDPSPLAGAERLLHYQIQAKLGEGGMGIVYKALDERLNRFVALKFLPPQIEATGVNLQRFLQEANALSALNHPNIATIYAVETAGDRQFLSMEFLPGGTLKAKLELTKSGSAILSFDDVLKYAQQTAEGLAHAHAHGIIHRDVKTSNLMLTAEGHLKITDFGLAKLTGSSLKTLPGGLMGTIPYMSPEQVLGMEVDARSDLFSFGVVLFELLSGRLPFQAPSDAAMLTQITNARAPRLREVRADAPRELERIVERALKKRLEDRYATTEELLADIRALRAGPVSQTRISTRNLSPALAIRRKPKWMLGLLATMLVAAVAAALLFHKGPPPKEPHTEIQAPNRLAVLPFRFVGPEQRNEKVAEQVISVLRNKLIQLEQFRGLLSVSSVADALKENVTNSKEAIARLGANLVLTGAVVEENDRFIITANLLDAQKQIVVNSTDVEGPIDKQSALSESLLQRVAEILHTQLRDANGARELSERARGYLGRYDRKQNLEIAIQLFEQALQRDPSYAVAHAGKAEAYLRNYRLTTEAPSLERARDSALAAMRFDVQFAPVEFAMGLYRHATGDYPGAVESFQRSLQIKPDADAARELGNSYSALNQLEAAEAAYVQAIQMRRGYWAGYKDLAVFYSKQGRLNEARPLLERVAVLAPDDYSSYTNLGALYVKLGMFSEGAAVLRQAVAIDPSAMAYYQLGTALFLGHRYPDAVEAYENAAALNPTDAVIWGGLGYAAHWVPGMADYAADAFNRALALRRDELKIRPRDARLRAEAASWLVYTDRRAALTELRTALRLSPHDSRVQSLAALVYEQSGMRNKALQAIEAAVKLGWPLEEMRRWPPLENLRQDPRYKHIVEASKVGSIVKPK